jgi:hypothetical protein
MPEFRFGIEEEYFVVDRRTASVKVRFSRPFMAAAKRKLGPSLMYELLQIADRGRNNADRFIPERLATVQVFPVDPGGNWA